MPARFNIRYLPGKQTENFYLIKIYLLSGNALFCTAVSNLRTRPLTCTLGFYRVTVVYNSDYSDRGNALGSLIARGFNRGKANRALFLNRLNGFYPTRSKKLCPILPPKMVKTIKPIANPYISVQRAAAPRLKPWARIRSPALHVIQV